MYIRRILTKKRAAWKKFKRSRTEVNLSRHKSLTLKARNLIRERVKRREEKLIDANNFNKFYNYVNRKFNINTPVGPLSDEHGNLLNDPAAKAQLLQNVFSSHFTVDNGIIPSMNVDSTCNIDTVTFTPELVRRAISRMKPKVKGGPDGIPSIFLKKCINELSSPLSFIFSQCLQSSFLPPVWLRAYITPIPKKGDSHDPNNYRPIAITSLLCKLMESVIKEQLLQCLLTNNVITKYQHGFLTKRSTQTNLLECTRDWSLAFSNTSSNDVIYIDLSKAFDSVVFSKLTFKLEQYGITGKLLDWIKAFLSKREQCVASENVFSSSCVVTSGVPQGSVLGPILFVLYINDITNICSNDVILTLYADDVKLYSNVRTNNSIDLQNTLNNLVDWASSWQLKINITKCHVLKIGGGNSITSYSIDGITLPSSSSISDLGIMIDCKLSYSQHINNIVTKCNQRIGMFFRGFVSRDLKLLSKFFSTYVRPIIEYNCCIWNPSVKYLIDLIENIQRKFTKRIQLISHLSYLERLSILNLEPLELRRLKFDLTMYFKIIHRLTCIDPDTVFSFKQTVRAARTESHPFILVKPAKQLQVLSNSFFYRSIAAWNFLPTSVVTASSICSFKNRLNNVDFNSFLIGSCFN